MLLRGDWAVIEGASALGRAAGAGNHFARSDQTMSQHNSLRSSSTLGAKRNVLKRFERVEILKKRTQWKEGDRVTGLRKTKPME